MAHNDPRVDAYIAKSPAFAKPILTYLRKAVHAGCPDVKETIKWRNPAFEYKGIFAGMAAFKQHCTFGFWKHSLLIEHGLATSDEEILVRLGKMPTVDDLPDQRTLVRLIKAAAALHDAGVKAPKKTRPAVPSTLTVPGDMKKALATNTQATAQFRTFSYSKKKDYVDWLTEAKTEATRARRLETAVGWIAEGKGRNWKYENC